MPKIIKKSQHEPITDRMKRKLRHNHYCNQRERNILPMNKELEKAERMVRERIVHSNPNASTEEIERQVKAIMEGGSNPTSENVPPPMPRHPINDERKRERLAIKKKGRRLRRT